MTFDRLCEQLPPRTACKTMVELLSLAHERACEAQLAQVLGQLIDDDQLPDLEALRSRFAPDPASLPMSHVQMASLSDYEALLNCDTEVWAGASTRRDPRLPAARRAAPARHQTHLGGLRRALRQGRLARCAFADGARRARDRR